MHIFLRGFAFIALGTAPVVAQMMAPPQEAAPVKATQSAAPEEDQPQMAPMHKATAPIKLPASKIAPTVPLSARERAVQMLNRFTYGPRPGDVEKVLAMGPDAWFEQQLHPDTIPDPALMKRLQDLPTLTMTAEQVRSRFPDEVFVRDVMNGKQPYPPDPILDAIYEAQIYKLQQADAYKKMLVTQPTDEAARTVENAARAAKFAEQQKFDQATAARVAGELFVMPKAQRLAALNAMPAADRVAFAAYASPDQRNTLFADLNPREREALYAMQLNLGGAIGKMYDELAQGKLLRSVLSERQLQEVMTDFWFNHFNVFQPKDQDQWYTTSYERDVIRANSLGKFRDLLLATAQSPAMMIYLDNFSSIGPDSIANGVNPANPKSKQGNRGLNENYGREVMELHTVGVGGGYSQADVTHLAAILTGWTVDRPIYVGPFQYNAKMHEPGTKEWFGYTIDDQGKVLAGPPGKKLPVVTFPANVPDGMKQGYTALTILADSPKTAHFISYMIAQRFIADDPPEPLVEKMAASFLASDGDIKTVLKTMVASPDFNSHKFFRNKVKTPLEFVASAYRTTATDPQNLGAMATLVGRDLGQPLYKALAPTGYYITADHWMNTQSLLARLNFADQLTHNRFANQKFDAPRVLALSLMNDPDAGTRNVVAELPAAGKARAVPVSATVSKTAATGQDVALHVLESSLIGGEISPKTDAFIHSQMAEQTSGSATDTLNLLTALLLGSPEFQLR